jgi:hypothetical protein
MKAATQGDAAGTSCAWSVMRLGAACGSRSRSTTRCHAACAMSAVG